jgi:predicted Zn-dependent protease
VPTSWDGHYLDGVTPARQAATVVVMARGLEIRPGSGSPRWWPLERIRQVQGAYAGEPVRLEHTGQIGEALIVPDPEFLRAVRAIAPGARRLRFHDPTHRHARVALTIVAALVAVALGAGFHRWGVPAAARLAAGLVPTAWEAQLGEQVFARAFPPHTRCVDEARQKVLDAILARLLAPHPPTPYRFRVTVVRWAAVNAYALPGGRLVVLQGLVDHADTPEMLAGTLAHEVAHVVHRHTTRSIFEAASTAALIAAATGDASGIALLGLEGGAFLGRLRYSREHEAEADLEGGRLLLAAGVDPRPQVAFFEAAARRRGEAWQGPWAYLSTHPTDAARLAAARALAAEAAAPPRPLVSDAEWKDLKRICEG